MTQQQQYSYDGHSAPAFSAPPVLFPTPVNASEFSSIPTNLGSTSQEMADNDYGTYSMSSDQSSLRSPANSFNSMASYSRICGDNYTQSEQFLDDPFNPEREAKPIVMMDESKNAD